VNPCSPGCPTGTVANNSSDFNGGAFIFDTEDGIVANWTGANSAVVAFDNSANGAVYKGLALLRNGSGIFLLASNFRTGSIDVLDRNFKITALAGSFTDPNLPKGFAPHGIHIINNQVFVTYAMQDSAKGDPAPGAGSGLVDVFDENGNFVKTFASGGKLNAPWGGRDASGIRNFFQRNPGGKFRGRDDKRVRFRRKIPGSVDRFRKQRDCQSRPVGHGFWCRRDG
jgi:uncharacterized protein (TIGR03118 family)